MAMLRFLGKALAMFHFQDSYSAVARAARAQCYMSQEEAPLLCLEMCPSLLAHKFVPQLQPAFKHQRHHLANAFEHWVPLPPLELLVLVHRWLPCASILTKLRSPPKSVSFVSGIPYASVFTWLMSGHSDYTISILRCFG